MNKKPQPPKLDPATLSKGCPITRRGKRFEPPQPAWGGVAAPGCGVFSASHGDHVLREALGGYGAKED